KPTAVVGGPGADLTYGYRRGDAPEVFLSPAEFLEEWESDRCVFVVGNRDLSLPGAVVLFEGPRSRLVVRDRCRATDTAAEIASLSLSARRRRADAGATAASPDRPRSPSRSANTTAMRSTSRPESRTAASLASPATGPS